MNKLDLNELYGGDNSPPFNKREMDKRNINAAFTA